MAGKGAIAKVIDWNLAAKIAGGGFGMVFMLLAMLFLSVRITKLIVDKIAKGEPKK